MRGGVSRVRRVSSQSSVSTPSPLRLPQHRLARPLPVSSGPTRGRPPPPAMALAHLPLGRHAGACAGRPSASSAPSWRCRASSWGRPLWPGPTSRTTRPGGPLLHPDRRPGTSPCWASPSPTAGVPLWNEYKRLGGIRALGYPASRRFIWNGWVAQVVQRGDPGLAPRERAGRAGQRDGRPLRLRVRRVAAHQPGHPRPLRRARGERAGLRGRQGPPPALPGRQPGRAPALPGGAQLAGAVRPPGLLRRDGAGLGAAHPARLPVLEDGRPLGPPGERHHRPRG